MTKKMELYKCERCGNIAEIVHRSGIPLVCCGIKMGLLEVKTADASTEKHVPVIEKIDGGYKVTVGSTPHPMTEEHYIELIDLIADNKVYREFLVPGAPAEAIFYVDAETFVPVSGRYYDRAGKIWRIAIGGFAHPDHHLEQNKGSGVAIPSLISMIDVQAKHCTTLKMKTQINVGNLKQKDFTVQSLRTKGR